MTDASSERASHLRPGLAIIPMQGAVQLRAGDEEICVVEAESPHLVERVLQQLAHGRPRHTITRDLGEEHGDLVDAVVEQLADQGLLVSQPVTENDEIGVFLSHFQGYQSTLHVQRPAGPIAVTGHTKCRELLVQALAQHGIETVEPCDPSQATAVFGDGTAEAVVCIWERPDLALALRVNESVCRNRLPCLFVDLSHGRHATLGPFYVPGEGACYQCYRARWRENTAALPEFEAAESTMLASGEPLTGYGCLPAFRYQLVGMACGELFAFLSRHRALRTLNRAATVDLDGLRLWTEPVWQVPWCPVCGVPT